MQRFDSASPPFLFSPEQNCPYPAWLSYGEPLFWVDANDKIIGKLMRAAFLLPLALLFACSMLENSVAPSNLPLENLSIEPGKELVIKIPPDANSSPPEANPQILLAVLIMDDAGNPVTADTVQVNEQIVQQGVDHFSLTLPANAVRETVVKIKTRGYATWVNAFRFNLQHSRRFLLPVQLQREPFFNEMDFE